MIIVCKLGNRYPDIVHPLHLKSWCDGQIVDILPDDAVIGKKVTESFACVRVSDVLDWKNNDCHKLVHPMDDTGKLPWNALFNESQVIKHRSYFLDMKWLVDNGYMNEVKRSDLYKKDISVAPIETGVSLETILRIEGTHERLDKTKLEVPGSIAQDDWEIGSGADYNTIPLFEADIAAALTGDLRGLHRKETTACGSAVDFDIDTGVYKLTLTAKDGAEHDGADGSFAKVDFADYDNIGICGNCDDADISKLILDARGTANVGITFTGFTTDGGTIRVFRNLVIGNSNATAGIYFYQDVDDISYYLFNNFIWGFSRAADTWANGRGIAFHNQFESHDGIFYLYNNTVAKCTINIGRYSTNYGTHTWKNNLCQGAGTSDYANPTATTAKNVSQDATSPDVAYRSLNKQSKFVDYANDKYLLQASDTDLDDGDDLSVIFTDDVIGLIRSAWYVGGSEFKGFKGSSAHTAFRFV